MWRSNQSVGSPQHFGHSSHKITEQCEGGYELRLFGGLINRKMNLPWLSSSPNYERVALFSAQSAMQ